MPGRRSGGADTSGGRATETFLMRPLAGLRRGNLLREGLAGISLIAIAVPLNIGYAQIAGLPPTAGLYALIIPTLCYALLASSRQLVVSPDAAASAMVFSSLLALGAAGEDMLAMASAQAVLGGLMFLAAGMLRLGFLANFLSHPILVGFVSGLAIEIMLSQVAKMLGVTLPAGGGFFEDVVELFAGIPQMGPWSVLVSLPALALLVLGRRLWPAVPWALVVIVAATLVSNLLDLPGKGVSVLGYVEAGPPVIAFPELPLPTWLGLIPSALALTMVGLAEGLLLARSYGERRGYPVRPNQELLAMGAANLAAGCSSSYTVGSSASRTAAMDQAGARTQFPAVILAAGAALLLIFGTGLLAGIPSPAIGAVVAVAVARLLGFGSYRSIWAESRSEFAVAVVCALGVLLVGPIGGILIAFVLSLVNLVRRAASPPIDVLVGPDDPQVSLTEAGAPGVETAPGLVVLRFAAPLFFANGALLVEQGKAAVEDAPNPVRALVLDMESVTDIDVSGAASLRALHGWLRERGVTPAYSRVRTDIGRRLIHFGLSDGIVSYPTNRAAVAALSQPGTSREP